MRGLSTTGFTPRLTLTMALVMTLVGAFALARPTVRAQDEATPRTAQVGGSVVNVELILDSSGSMAEEIEPGQSRIAVAKSVLGGVIEAIPDEEGINVGFRVYGHKGNNTESGRSESCRSTELRVPIEGVDREALLDEVAAYQPVGWTPIALSLREAAKDFPPAEEGVTNAVVLVTDGLETCSGDPCAASRTLKNGPGDVTTHVIGFALSEEERSNLQCIVDESGGLLLGADNAQELSDALFIILEEVEVVVRNGSLEIESIGGVFPKATIEGEAGATDADPEGEAFSATLTDLNRIELPAGNYSVRWANPSGEETVISVAVEAEQTTFIAGSIFRFPHGSGDVYLLKATDGTVIWRDAIETGDQVWVLPGLYRLELEELSGSAVIVSLDVQTAPGAVTQIDVTVAS